MYSVNYSNKGECVNISAQSDSSEDKTPDTDFIKNIIKNLTEEGDEFKKKLTTFGWVYFSLSFYYISSIKKSWEESRNDLVIINSKEEQVCMRVKSVDVGLRFTLAMCSFGCVWCVKTFLLFGFSYWNAGEPNSYMGKNEDCGEIRFSKEDNSWNDTPCENSNFWICEKVVVL
ncbi:CD209 antigen-like protein A [Micropterus salmoides]|uniref:CD209 antigen-like protein A n=1 Tax=Micropterus salmoides TaxID=27706 RepID=UPI0018EC3E40|nr:CD209 antigen-like protein A [Micropterus salmoides]